MKYLYPLIFAGLFTACGPESEATVENSEPTAEQLNADNPAATLRTTVDAVQANGGDITGIPSNVAVSNINHWIDQLEDVDGADKVTGNLEALRSTLTSSPLNGQLVGMQLISLAEDAREVGGSAPGISALVSALRAGGKKLTTSAFADSTLLDQTLQAGKSKAADITTLPVSVATENVDGWITELRGMDGADDIVADLESLKQELGAPSIDGEKVSELLFSLAKGTRSVADGNPGLETLAYLLESGGWRLEGMSGSN